MSLEIVQFPCLSDNYGFLVHDPDSGLTACVDTPDAAEISKVLADKGWTLDHIWNTHHHWDHTGGNAALAEKYGCAITGPGHDAARIPGMSIGVRGGDSFQFGAYQVQILETPGHTLGHIVFYLPEAQAAFVGDTVFALGCGRLFEGTPEQMFESFEKIKTLPPQTKLYCAHEYTLANARFAVTAEPENPALIKAVERYTAMRGEGLPTVPTTLAAELDTNPFLRAENAKVLGERRAAKDNFKG